MCPWLHEVLGFPESNRGWGNPLFINNLYQRHPKTIQLVIERYYYYFWNHHYSWRYYHQPASFPDHYSPLLTTIFTHHHRRLTISNRRRNQLFPPFVKLPPPGLNKASEWPCPIHRGTTARPWGKPTDQPTNQNMAGKTNHSSKHLQAQLTSPFDICWVLVCEFCVTW